MAGLCTWVTAVLPAVGARLFALVCGVYAWATMAGSLAGVVSAWKRFAAWIATGHICYVTGDVVTQLEGGINRRSRWHGWNNSFTAYPPLYMSIDVWVELLRSS